jgi:hypothetical protein
VYCFDSENKSEQSELFWGPDLSSFAQSRPAVQRRNWINAMEFGLERNLDEMATVLEELRNLKEILAVKHPNHKCTVEKANE